MGAYITKWCNHHGEWECDVDSPDDECEQCLNAGNAPSQIAAQATERLLAENAELKRLGYLAGIAAATPEQLEELRELCRPEQENPNG